MQVDLTYLFFLFRNISPYFWSALGISLCVGLSVVGAAWCVRAADGWTVLGGRRQARRLAVDAAPR